MKILHLINLQGFGGAERLFIEYLKSSSFDNYIICTSNEINENILPELLDFNITYSNRLVDSWKLKYPTFIRSIVLNKKIEKIKPNLTIVWDFVPKLFKKPRHSALVYYDHGCSWQYQKNKKVLRFFSMLDAGICVSHASKRIIQLRFNYKNPLYTIVNKLNIKQVKETKKLVSDEPIILGTASRLVGLKGIGVSVLTLAELINRGVKCKLLIAGVGEVKAELENLVKQLKMESYVDFLGYQSDMTLFYQNIDIYMSTSVKETCSLSCIESLAHAVPVVFSIVDGQPEAVKDGYYGIGIKPTVSIDQHKKLTGIDTDFPHQVYDPINDQLTEPKLVSHIDCADAVERLLKDPSLYESMSKNALEWSKESMNYDKFLNEFEDALREIAKPSLS
ncbi:glycosyltransferase family 4 protein [Xenorhabdus szentirmaii]|uniref:Glycosyltransferase family 4 protein n=1 Tax=Xenorhabdus szentirmaii TaxID=290112 RepID=A0AAW3YS88_9GAMM|nr:MULTISPECIES: glycosyltransferase family 4 protein [unclassified Xenorhabdus]MBD2792805.1 glycosyltransferase family 4 protein [Xenorhabdus sp. CUL]MBD2800367.1 glycosyltransferase family 4 protein [Xenorhabdus sp. M]